jgi:IS30 family transposase
MAVLTPLTIERVRQSKFGYSLSRLVKLTIECKHLIDNCLNLDWLPEQVCGWLKGSG